MAVNKVEIMENGSARTIIDLTEDTVEPEALAEGYTAHDPSGQKITGKMPITTVLYTEQTLTNEQKAQARENIGAVSEENVSSYSTVVYGTCSTAAATAEKAVTVDNENWELSVGSVVMVHFDVSNSASNVTLNVNGTGAYPIWYNNAEYTSTGTAYTGYAKRVIAYMFNGTHWVWITSSYDANTTYKNVALGHGYVTCSTAEATAAKVGTLASYALTVGGIVAVKFTNAVPANATLNINSKGAKNIFYRGAKIVANVIKAGDIATFIYDGTQYQLLSIDRWQADISELSETIVDQQSAISRQQLELEEKQPKGNYLTSIPSEYITEDELEAELNDLKAQGVQQVPLFANDIEECTDTTKVYVLPDGYIYGYIKTKTEGGTVPNFTNLMDNPNSYIKDGYRYSHSSAVFKENAPDCAVVVPIPSTAGEFKLRIRGASINTCQYASSAYFGTDNQNFSGTNTTIHMSYTTESNGDLLLHQKVYNGGYNYFVFHIDAGVDVNNLIVTLNEEITYTTTEGGYEYKWGNTGRAFVPTDYENRIIDVETEMADHEERLDYLENNRVNGMSLEHNSCSIFRKVVCCGDSFTAGYIGTTTDNVIQTNYDYAYPSFMARLTGNEYVNCGHSGKDVITWQTSTKGLPRARSAGKAQAYLLGLGLNDVGTVGLGTISDIGTENQTYYGGLSKIIRELNTISPTAKIFVQTIPKESSTYLQYNEAMRNVVNAYKDTYPVHLLDLYAYRDMYKTTKVTGDAIMGHHTAIGYQQFAENLRYIWSDYINKNISEFQDVYLIPYDETPSNL